MNLDNFVKSLKYTPKIWTALSYPFLLLLSLILFFGRNYESLRISWILNLFQDFYSHISNFSISFFIYITIGYVGLWFNLTLKWIVLTGIFLLFTNLIVELLIPILNTPDIIDAVYGSFGILLGFTYLCIIKGYGFNLNKLYEP